MINKHQKIELPIDTTLYPNESEVNIGEWREKLGGYKRIRVRKPKFLKTQVARKQNIERAKSVSQMRKNNKNVIESFMKTTGKLNDNFTLEKVIVSRAKWKLKKKYKGDILKVKNNR